jgi:hypothetical protein
MPVAYLAPEKVRDAHETVKEFITIHNPRTQNPQNRPDSDDIKAILQF